MEIDLFNWVLVCYFEIRFLKWMGAGKGMLRTFVLPFVCSKYSPQWAVLPLFNGVPQLFFRLEGEELESPPHKVLIHSVLVGIFIKNTVQLWHYVGLPLKTVYKLQQVQNVSASLKGEVQGL